MFWFLDSEAVLSEIAAVLKSIRPDEVHILQPTRPPAETWVQPPDEEGLLRARGILGDITRVIHPASGSFDLSGAQLLVDAIVGIITRHLMREDEMLVVITGCAHPGIVAIVERARDMFAQPVRLVLGGFHLGSKSEAEIDAILEDFRRLEVEQVGPCHCTGERAMTRFALEYGKNFIQVGVGSVIKLEE